MSLEIGLRLKEARESLGLTIQDIRDRTRIETGYLIALENGEFDKLPSPYFVRMCIRAYAKCVGIEPHHLLKKYHPIPGDSGGSDSSSKRNTGRQRAVQDRSRFTSTFPRLSSAQESVKASGEEREGQEPRSLLERTARMDSLAQKTNPNLGTDFSSGDTDHNGTPSRRESDSFGQDRAAGDSGPEIKNRNTGRQRAVQDRSRLTSTFPRLSSAQESAKASGEERERQEPRSLLERTARMDSLSQKTNPSIKTGSPADVAGSFDKGESQYLPQPLFIRSRRSERARESLSSRKFRRAIIMAGGALFIPLAAWGAVSLLKDDPAGEPSRTTVQQQSDPEGVNAAPLTSPEDDFAEGATAEVTLVDNSGGIARYQTAATGELVVEIGPVTDICWVQIRENPEGGGNYLKDVTLRNNEIYRYKHPADGSDDLYIEFGAPHAVQQIRVNGQPINSSKIIHIKRNK